MFGNKIKTSPPPSIVCFLSSLSLNYFYFKSNGHINLVDVTTFLGYFSLAFSHYDAHIWRPKKLITFRIFLRRFCCVSRASGACRTRHFFSSYSPCCPRFVYSLPKRVRPCSSVQTTKRNKRVHTHTIIYIYICVYIFRFLSQSYRKTVARSWSTINLFCCHSCRSQRFEVSRRFTKQLIGPWPRHGVNKKNL